MPSVKPTEADSHAMVLIVQVMQHNGILDRIDAIDVLESGKALVCCVTGASDDSDESVRYIAKLKVVGCTWRATETTDAISHEYCDAVRGSRCGKETHPEEWLRFKDVRTAVRSALLSSAMQQPFHLIAYIQNYTQHEHKHPCSLVLEIQSYVGLITVEKYMRKNSVDCDIPFVGQCSPAQQLFVDTHVDSDSMMSQSTTTTTFTSDSASDSTTGYQLLSSNNRYGLEHCKCGDCSSSADDTTDEDAADMHSLYCDEIVDMETSALANVVEGIDTAKLHAAQEWAEYTVRPVCMAIALSIHASHKIGVVQHDGNLKNLMLSLHEEYPNVPVAHIIDYEWATVDPSMYDNLICKYKTSLPQIVHYDARAEANQFVVSQEMLDSCLFESSRGTMYVWNSGEYADMLGLTNTSDLLSAMDLYLYYSNQTCDAGEASTGEDVVLASNLMRYLTRYVVIDALGGRTLAQLHARGRMLFKRKAEHLGWLMRVAQYATVVVILAHRLFRITVSPRAVRELMQHVPTASTKPGADLALNESEIEDGEMYGYDNAILRDARVVAYLQLAADTLEPLTEAMYDCVPLQLRDDEVSAE